MVDFADGFFGEHLEQGVFILVPHYRVGVQVTAAHKPGDVGEFVEG